MRIKLVILLLLCCILGATKAQEKKLVQFSGIITTSDSTSFVPYVTITNKTDRNHKYVANYKGYFSFVVHETDSLIFTAIGYKPTTITIPTNIFDQRFTHMVKMTQVVINLQTVHVFPWANLEEFNTEFMALKIADDDLEIAKKNLSRDKLSASFNELPRDGQEMRGYDFQIQHYNMLNKNMDQRYSNPLLNPFAWKAFLEQIFQGDKKRAKN